MRGRPLVAVWREICRWGAQEEERAVGDGVLQSFCGALRVVLIRLCLLNSPACTPSLAPGGARAGPHAHVHTACEHCATHSAGSNAAPRCTPGSRGRAPKSKNINSPPRLGVALGLG